jgi:hypothetical protein
MSGHPTLRHWAGRVTAVTFPRPGVRDTPIDVGFARLVPGAPCPDVIPGASARCARRTHSLTCHGVTATLAKPTHEEGDILLSESTVRASVKITSALAAGLALSLAGAGSALADTTGDASGGGDFGFDVTGPQLPPPPTLPAPPAPSASASAGTSVGVDTPLGSTDGGFSTGFGGNLGLPTLPPPPPPPPASSASDSAGAHLGFGF